MNCLVRLFCGSYYKARDKIRKGNFNIYYDDSDEEDI